MLLVICHHLIISPLYSHCIPLTSTYRQCSVIFSMKVSTSMNPLIIPTPVTKKVAKSHIFRQPPDAHLIVAPWLEPHLFSKRNANIIVPGLCSYIYIQKIIYIYIYIYVLYIPYASKGHIWYSRYVLAYTGVLEAIPGCFPGIGEQFSQYRLSWNPCIGVHGFPV